MKKILLIALLVAALIVPVTAQAATEFALGGYIRLDALWASQNNFSYAFSSFIPRNNGGANTTLVNTSQRTFRCSIPRIISITASS